jgi:SagB-type dehydrogenase family enzyme
MKASYKSICLLIISALISLSSFSYAQQFEKITLPAPKTDIGKPLMQALKLRQSTRSFDTKELSLQEISNLLWAADGINRPGTGKRTAPSAMNWQEISVYVCMEKGTYVYDAEANSLNPVQQGDLRKYCGTQDFVKSAPLNLVYVADYAKVKNSSDEDMKFYTAADCGFIAENVYLYCASEGLGAVIRANIDRKKLAEVLNLKPDQKILLSQTIGYGK